MIKQCLHFDYNEKLLKTKKQDADIIGVEKCYTSRELKVFHLLEFSLKTNKQIRLKLPASYNFLSNTTIKSVAVIQRNEKLRAFSIQYCFSFPFFVFTK